MSALAAEWNDPIAIDSIRRHAETLVETLVDEGPATGIELRKWLGWGKGRFTSALRYARETLCPELGLVIPQPTPTDDWRYQVTTDWQPVEAGSSYALGIVESRLRAIHRDVTLVAPHLEPGSVPWRRARFLQKHLDHIVNTLGEINGSR